MNDDQFDDLKQFIETTVLQTEARLRTDLANKADLARLEAKVDDGLARLEAKVDDGFAGVGDAISSLSDDIDRRFDEHKSRLDDHDKQLRELRQRAA